MDKAIDRANQRLKDEVDRQTRELKETLRALDTDIDVKTARIRR
jgi:hypothetical protein